ncbi:AAA family ATPase [Demequina activiva]|uniref:Nuclease SbcCD subunit C n=1 Tax=Demequina activiva TaxID=1582364 RepID=A0A919UJ25_9MICO|nr:AAA family ATPase [Demequina activiva]GIG53335.1 hypothetical protein Dac01nite_00870 [Demequina activiva]
MQISELELVNWGPYYGKHRIPLDVTPHAPVVLFRGENMRGKTSLLRGIVWALYGEIREQDGRTPLDVGRMVNTDALETGETEFGVRLKFVHAGAEFTLYRTSIATEDRPGKVTVQVPKLDLKPGDGLPYPVAQIPDVINGILSRDISDFFLFDGEMLSRFEERLREERSSAQGFVRTQVERALGLPFLGDLWRDMDAVLDDVTKSIDQVVRKEKAHHKDSEAYRAKADELKATEKNLLELEKRERALTQEIDEIEAQLAKLDEVKDAYHERKGLQRELDASHDTIKDYRQSIAERAEQQWWLPMADKLFEDLQDIEDWIVAAEKVDREQLRTRIKIEQLEGQLGSGYCSACGQPVATHNEDELSAEIAQLEATLQYDAESTSLDELRVRRDRLRKFSTAPSSLQWLHDQERDLRREKLKNDRRAQQILHLTDQLQGTTVEIDALERNLLEAKGTKQRLASLKGPLEIKRGQIKAEVNRLGVKLAQKPEVDPDTRRLQAMAEEGSEIVARSYDGFRSAMRERVQTATSQLFRTLTTESDYSGVSISDDYRLAVLHRDGRAQGMISAGANQILTMAFIGALGECSVDEAPMVMDTPFGRLDIGHRRAILEWVGTFDRQVILFVQSGEYDPTRDAAILAGKIGREYTIDRLSAKRSEVNPA